MPAATSYTKQFSSTWYQTPHDTLVSAICAEGDKVVSAGIDSQVILWQIKPDGEKKLLHSLQKKMGSHTCGCTCVDIKGTTLATCTNDGAIRIWDLRSGQNTATLSGSVGNSMWCRWADNGQHLISAGIDGTLCTWDVSVSAPPKKTSVADCAVQGLSVSGSQVAFGTFDGCIGVYDMQSNNVVAKGKMHREMVRSVQMVNDKIFSCGDDGQIVVTDPKKLNMVKDQGVEAARLMSFSGHDGAVYGIAVDSSDDGLLMSCGADGKSIVWDWENREMLQEFHHHKDGAWTATSMENNNQPVFLSGGRDRGVCVYTLPTYFEEEDEVGEIQKFSTAAEL